VDDSSSLEFGDRLGSMVALTFFVGLFCVLGFVTWWEVRRRAPRSSILAAVLGTVLFAGPVILIYASSLGGFYRAEFRGDSLVLGYLYPGAVEMSVAEVQEIRVAPAFRGRWRLQIVRSGGAEYQSATWHRDVVDDAAQRLRLAVRSAR
jgi:hypothetical protein